MISFAAQHLYGQCVAEMEYAFVYPGTSYVCEGQGDTSDPGSNEEVYWLAGDSSCGVVMDIHGTIYGERGTIIDTECA
jgi:hypothetical protein